MSAPTRPGPGRADAADWAPVHGEMRAVGRSQLAMAETLSGGPGPSGWATRWAARICRTATGSSTVAITRNRPPQFGQANTSSANARRMRAAQVQLRRGGDGPGRVSAGSSAAASGATRP